MRKLATIFAADVANYSRHIDEDETRALAYLTELRRLMDPLIERHGGRIANTAGDSVVAVFESPVEAVLAAIEIQAAHKAYNSDVAAGNRLLFRVGINIGDITVQPNGDVLGAGVNIAARLETIAQPGGICVSENVYEQVDRKLPSDLRKIGEHYVKNIEKPIRVYAIGHDDSAFITNLVRQFSGLLKKPVFQAAVALLAITAVALSLFAQGQNPRVVEAGSVRNEFADLSQEEILSKFDLVTKGSFGNSTYYVIRFWGGLSIDDLNLLANALDGHVVSINSEEENSYIFDLSLHDAGHWVVVDGTNGPQSSGPMIGLVQEPSSGEPDQGWRWLNGEQVTFQSWREGSPDNSGGNQSVSQFRVNGTRALPYWDDIGSVQESVIVEVPDGTGD